MLGLLPRVGTGAFRIFLPKAPISANIFTLPKCHGALARFKIVLRIECDRRRQRRGGDAGDILAYSAHVAHMLKAHAGVACGACGGSAGPGGRRPRVEWCVWGVAQKSVTLETTVAVVMCVEPLAAKLPSPVATAVLTLACQLAC